MTGHLLILLRVLLPNVGHWSCITSRTQALSPYQG